MLRLIIALCFIGVASCQLSSAEINILRRSWIPYSKLTATNAGVKILVAWFTAYPDAQNGFSEYQGMPLDLLTNFPDFRNQGSLYYRVIDEGIWKSYLGNYQGFLQKWSFVQKKIKPNLINFFPHSIMHQISAI